MSLGWLSLGLRTPSFFPPRGITCSFYFRLGKSDRPVKSRNFSKASACSCHGIASHFSHLTVLCLSHPLETPCPFSCFVEADDGGCAWQVWPAMSPLWHLMPGLGERQGHSSTMEHRYALSWGPGFKRDFQHFSRSLLPGSFPVTGLPDPLLYHTWKMLGLQYWERSSLQRPQKA